MDESCWNASIKHVCAFQFCQQVYRNTVWVLWTNEQWEVENQQLVTDAPVKFEK